mgnify:FL=1
MELKRQNKILNINAVRIDGGTQSRVALHDDTVSDYADSIVDGVTLPPVSVFFDGSDYWLADGFHRYHAYRKAGKTSIPAEVSTGAKRDAILYAAGANIGHGLRRTNADKRRAVEMILADADCAENWTDREIASHCAVSAPFVGAVRRPEVAARQGQNRAASERPYSENGCNPITPITPVGLLDGAPIATARPTPKHGPVESISPEDDGPSANELADAQREAEEEIEALRKIALADDRVAAALEEAKQLRSLNRVLQERNDGLMNEKAELVKRIKGLQRKVEKLEKGVPA